MPQTSYTAGIAASSVFLTEVLQTGYADGVATAFGILKVKKTMLQNSYSAGVAASSVYFSEYQKR